MDTASGSRAHSRTSSAAASGSASTRSLPSTRTSSAIASSGVSSPRVSWWASWSVTRSVSRLRLVTRVKQDGLLGSSGRTWSVSAALSSTTSIRLVLVIDW